MALINVKNVCLDLPVYGAEEFSLRRKLLVGFPLSKHQPKTVSALKNISISIQDGDRYGLVGLNGAGKSSFLKLLAQIYPPTKGDVSVSGPFSTIFDLSLGMSDEGTGYENLFIAGYMLGRSRAEIQYHLDEIVEFTELGDALLRPIRTYSSGMRVRLAFAVATSFGSEILLIDEIIGVGDARFLNKASQRIRQRADEAKIIVLASHAEFVLRDFCDKGILFHEGEIVDTGPIDDVIAEYNKNYVDVGL